MKQRNRKQIRFGTFDFILIFSVLLCVLGVFLRLQALKGRSESEVLETFELLTESQGIDPRIIDCVRVGDILYTVSGEKFGTVCAVSKIPETVVLPYEGAYLKGVWASDKKCRAAITILVLGTQVNSVFMREGRFPIPVGQQITLYTDLAELHLTTIKYTSSIS